MSKIKTRLKSLMLGTSSCTRTSSVSVPENSCDKIAMRKFVVEALRRNSKGEREDDDKDNQSSLYARFVELHRRLSNPYRKVSDGEFTTDVDVDSEQRLDNDYRNVSEGLITIETADTEVEEKCEDPEDSQRLYHRSPAPSNIAFIRDVEEPNDVVFEKHESPGFRAVVAEFLVKFNQCTLGHLVMASFLNHQKSKRLTSVCLSVKMLKLVEVKKATDIMAALLNLSHLSLEEAWTAPVVCMGEVLDEETLLNLIWHNERMFEEVDQVLMRRQQRKTAKQNVLLLMQIENRSSRKFLKLENRSRTRLSELRRLRQTAYE